jgi:hypothetical protein
MNLVCPLRRVALNAAQGFKNDVPIDALRDLFDPL